MGLGVVEILALLVGLVLAVLASGVLGWVSLLTDPAFPAALMPVRPVHVAFAAAFCLSCILWGGMHFVGSPSPQRSKS